ncbi:MAG: hypothetical protein IT436_17885 [Phycisphaerales bacterium]|nr:hypothetical protein [Phycisphaerales bacterium]
MAKRSRASSKPAPEVAIPAPELPPHPRPVPLSSIQGQDRALATLDAALRSGRLHHAWIFHGPSGVGKFTTALAFAAVLLDPTSTESLSGGIQPDPDSPVQRLLASGTHPDLHIITKELSIFSEDADVRKSKQITIPKNVIDTHLLGPAALSPTLRHTPAPRASKVFIVDEAELLDRSPNNAPTQNAILKTLEEPPPGTVIILVTSSEDRLLPTIRSRCQRVGFGPLEPAAMRKWMAGRGLEVEARLRDWLIGFSEGSPGVLLAAIEGGFYAWFQALEPMLDTTQRGGYDPDLGPTMARLADDWAKAWVEANELASKESANRAGARWILRLLSAWLRGGLRRAESASRHAEAIDLVRQAERRLDSSVQLAFVMESLSAELAGLFAAERAAARAG